MRGPARGSIMVVKPDLITPSRAPLGTPEQLQKNKRPPEGWLEPKGLRSDRGVGETKKKYMDEGRKGAAGGGRRTEGGGRCDEEEGGRERGGMGEGTEEDDEGEDEEDEAEERADGRTGRGHIDPMYFEEFPWLLDAIRQERRRRARASPGGGSGGVDAGGENSGGGDTDKEDRGESDGSDASADMGVDDIFAELEKKREEERAEHGACEPGRPFSWTVMGGEWALKNLGVVYDSFRSHAVGEHVERWCWTYRFNKSFSVALTYGEGDARVLVQEWTARMCYFHAAHAASGEARYVFTQADIDGYRLSAAFEHAEAAAGGALQARFAQVRRLRPAGPR